MIFVFDEICHACRKEKATLKGEGNTYYCQECGTQAARVRMARLLDNMKRRGQEQK